MSDAASPSWRPVRNTAWGIADQIVSGLSNVALAIAGASVSTTEEFGVLSAAIIALTGLVSVSRAGLGNAVAIAARAGDGPVRADAGHGAALLCCLAPALAAFVAGVAWITGSSATAGVVVLMGLAAPVVLIQDLLRFQASALSRSAAAFVADLACLVLMAILLATVLIANMQLDLVTVTAAWVAGAVFAMAILAGHLRMVPRIAGLAGWSRARGSFLLHAAGGTGAVSAANVGRVTLIGSARGASAVGSLAGGQLLMTPLNLLVALIPFAATPVIARRVGGTSAVRSYASVALGGTIAGLGWWGVCAAIPDGVGQAVLGDVWAPAIALLAPMALLSIGVLVNASGMSLLLYQGRPRAYGAVAITVASLNLLGTVAALRLGGQVWELAWTQTAVVLVGTVLSWTLASRPTRPRS